MQYLKFGLVFDLIQEYLFSVSKKVIRTNTENSAEVGLFVTHSFSFVYSNSN